MSTRDHCLVCESPYSEGAVFCSSCGKARFTQPSVDQSYNQAGTNIVAGGNVTLADADRWDTRPRTAMSRNHQHRFWSPDWISGISVVITIFSFMGVESLPTLQTPMIIVGLIAAILACVAFMASSDLKTDGYHVLPGQWGTLERGEDDSTWRTEPTAQCPLCPDHRLGTMYVTRSPKGPKWVCKNTPSHCFDFDGTQLPLLETNLP